MLEPDVFDALTGHLGGWVQEQGEGRLVAPFSGSTPELENYPYESVITDP